MRETVSGRRVGLCSFWAPRLAAASDCLRVPSRCGRPAAVPTASAFRPGMTFVRNLHTAFRRGPGSARVNADASFLGMP